MRHPILGLIALGAILACVAAEEEGLRAQYFTNATLTSPIAVDTTTPTVSFNWGSAGPAGVGVDHFSARWSGQVIPTETGPHTMFMRSDAGARVWLNGTLIINDWSAHSARDTSAIVDLVGGTPVDLIIEYYENTGNAVAQLSWATPSLARHPIPSSKLRPTLLVNPFGTGTGLTGFYYAGKNFDRLALTRLDSRVAFTWGSGAPAMEIPADNFSVRWLGSYEAQRTEALTLIARADDGVRVWLDGAAVIDDWVPTSARDRTYTFNAEAGRRYSIRMDYFEAAGSASAVLEFQGPNTPRAAVSTQFYPVEGVQVSLPSASPVSPVFIEGLYAPDVTVTATADGDAVPVEALSDIAFYLDCPLSPTAPIQMTLQAGEFQHAASIAWTPTPVVGVSEATIRAGDALLFQTMADGYRRIDHESGVELPEVATQAGELWPFRFGRAGIYHVLTLDGAGEVTGKMVVTVVGVAMPERVASKVNYARIFETEFRPLSATPVFVANDPTYLTVSQAVPVDGIVAVTSKPLRRGSPQVLARLYANGPIIARTVVDEFSYSVASLRQAVVNAATGIGTSTLVMHPYVEDVEFRLDMFAHKGRFKGGVKSFRINTSASQSTHGEPGFTTKVDETTGETIGIFRFDLEIPPNESMYCYRIRAWQANEVVAVDGAGENTVILGQKRASTSEASLVGIIQALFAATSGGDSAASSSENVNGDVCHVQCLKSLIFLRAYSDEDEKNEENPEPWTSRQFTLWSAESCMKQDKGDGDCSPVTYRLRVSQPSGGAGLTDNPKRALFGASREYSDCKPCDGVCDPVSPYMDTGTYPATYTTSTEVCSAGSGDSLGGASGGQFWVSKLDAHGVSGTSSRFRELTTILPKRRGSLVEPVIQMDSGGDGAFNGCSLYGYIDGCSQKNEWQFTAIAKDENGDGENLPDNIEIRWINLPSYEVISTKSNNIGDQPEKIKVKLPIGRHFPKLEIWSHHGDEPKHISSAEIHSIAVEGPRQNSVGKPNSPVEEEIRTGQLAKLSNYSGGLPVDARARIVPGSQARGRISLDGYPQNEYWVTAGDVDDLAQVATVEDGGDIDLYLQGYQEPSYSQNELTVRIDGQAFLEACTDCSGGPNVTEFMGNASFTEWQQTDEEPFDSVRIRTVVEAMNNLGEGGEAHWEESAGDATPRLSFSITNPTFSGNDVIIPFAGELQDFASEVASDSYAVTSRIDVLINGVKTSEVPVEYSDGDGQWRQRTLNRSFQSSVTVPNGRLLPSILVTLRNHNDAGEQHSAITSWVVPIDLELITTMSPAQSIAQVATNGSNPAMAVATAPAPPSFMEVYLATEAKSYSTDAKWKLINDGNAADGQAISINGHASTSKPAVLELGLIEAKDFSNLAFWIRMKAQGPRATIRLILEDLQGNAVHSGDANLRNANWTWLNAGTLSAPSDGLYVLKVHILEGHPSIDQTLVTDGLAYTPRLKDERPTYRNIGERRIGTPFETITPEENEFNVYRFNMTYTTSRQDILPEVKTGSLDAALEPAP